VFCFCKKKKADDEKEKAEQAGKEEERGETVDPLADAQQP
jgi:hypothetical protein